MKFLKALFPGADVAEKVVTSGMNMIGKAFYTDQEKAEDAQGQNRACQSIHAMA